MESIGRHTNHLEWVDRILSSPRDFSDISVRYAKQVAEERNLPIWQQFKEKEGSHA